MKMKELNYLKKKNNLIKNNILDVCYFNGGHIATSFSCSEILCYLYYKKIINFSKKKSDILIISKGHSSEAIYSILTDLGKITKKNFNKNYSAGNYLLGEHISKQINGIEFSSGSLGHGLPFACGKALALKKNKINNKRVFVLTGDAEFCEGSMWESLMFALQQKLSNLYIIIDYNKIGSLDFLSNTAPLEKFFKQLKEIGFKTFSIKNGNNFNEIDKIFLKLKKNKSQNPKIIFLNTIKGSGVKLFENDPIWHVKKISAEDYKNAKNVLKAK